MTTHTKSGLDITTGIGCPEHLAQPFVIELPARLTVGIMMEILSRVPSGTKILCDFNEFDSKSFSMTCLRYDGKRLLEITIEH